MALHYGNTDISKIYFGNSEVSKIYYGNTLIYEAGGEPTPPTEIPTKVVVEIANDGDSAYAPCDVSSVTYIDWGDGSTTIENPHTYATAGTYTIYVYGITRLSVSHNYKEIECGETVTDYYFGDSSTFNPIIVETLKLGDNTIKSFEEEYDVSSEMYYSSGLDISAVTNKQIYGNGIYIPSRTKDYVMLCGTVDSSQPITIHENVRVILGEFSNKINLVQNSVIEATYKFGRTTDYYINVPNFECWHNANRSLPNFPIGKMENTYPTFIFEHCVISSPSFKVIYFEERFAMW